MIPFELFPSFEVDERARMVDFVEYSRLLEFPYLGRYCGLLVFELLEQFTGGYWFRAIPRPRIDKVKGSGEDFFSKSHGFHHQTPAGSGILLHGRKMLNPVVLRVAVPIR